MQAPSTTRVLRSPSSSVSTQPLRLTLPRLPSGLGAVLPAVVVELVDPLGHALLVVLVGEVRAERAAARPRGRRRRCRGSRCRRCRSSSRSARSGRSGTPARRRPGPGTRSRRGERRDRPRARRAAYAPASVHVPAPVASWHAPRCARHRLQHGPPARGRRLPWRRADAGVLLQGGAAARRAPREGRHGHRARASTRSPSSSATPSTLAEDKGCEEIYSFATSAVRDAGNCDDVLAHVEDRTGVADQGAAGRGRGPADLPRRTPLVRLVLGPPRRLRHRRRLARDRRRRRRVARRGLVAAARRRPAHPRALRRRAAGDKAMRKLRKQIRTEIAHDAGTLLRGGAPDHAVATSKTFRSLARICGAAPSSEGLFVRRILPGRRPRRVDPQAARDGPRRHRRAAGRLQRPRPPGASPAPSSPPR